MPAFRRQQVQYACQPLLVALGYDEPESVDPSSEQLPVGASDASGTSSTSGGSGDGILGTAAPFSSDDGENGRVYLPVPASNAAAAAPVSAAAATTATGATAGVTAVAAASTATAGTDAATGATAATTTTATAATAATTATAAAAAAVAAPAGTADDKKPGGVGASKVDDVGSKSGEDEHRPTKLEREEVTDAARL